MGAPPDAQVKVVNDLMTVTQRVFHALTKSPECVPKVLNLAGWLVELMSEAFKLQRVVDKGVIGSRVLRAISLIAIEDVKQRRESTPSIWTDETEIFMLTALQGECIQGVVM